MSYQLRYGKDLIKFLEKHRNLAPTILERLEIIAKSLFDNNDEADSRGSIYK